MPSILRYVLMAPETVFYGLAYAAAQYFIRAPQPLDPEYVWTFYTRRRPWILEWLQRNYPPACLRRLLIAAKLRQDHLIGISEHYDVSNAFYELFLDKKYMFYSCADFPTGRETLEEAQTLKADFLLNLIEPKPGEKILDLGCGWGGMMRRIHEATGDKENLVGYTLSQEQADYIREHFGFRIEFKNFISCDYPRHEFDKIYSIGSWEHVRREDVDSTLAKLYEALKPGGRLVKHFFSFYTDRTPISGVTAQVFFPGSLPPSQPSQVKAFERAGFRILKRSIHDYRPTLRAWFDNLVANKDRAIELVGIRMYNKYLAFFAGSYRFFEDGDAMLVRYLMEKPA